MTASPTTTHDDHKNVIHDLYQQILQHAENSSGVSSLLLGVFLATGLTYERNLQRRLTRPPIVLGQLPDNSQIRHVYDILSATPDSILQRPLVPSLLVGTRAQLSSTAAFLKGGPAAQRRQYLRFREIITMIPDGAQIGIDWEVPLLVSAQSRSTGIASLEDTTTLRERRRREMETGPIKQPVVIILHGINNHSRFGYIQSLQRAFASRGWNACAMNFRGCGGVKMTTPRSYNAAYTGDLRSLVLQLAARMAKGVPIFLVGNSLGANVVTKYLGEEGLAKTLPSCVAGGISLGNPLLFYSDLIRFPFNVAMGQARKVTYLEQWHAIQPMNDAAFSAAKRKGLWSATLGQLDAAAAPVMIRADPHPPFGIKIGYEAGGHEYWMDSGCYKASRFISVPFVQVSAEDDFLCYKTTQRLLAYALSNPNIMIVETRTGGHLGWQESLPQTKGGGIFGITSWADVMSADFIQAVLKTRGTVDDQSKAEESSEAGMMRSRL